MRNEEGPPTLQLPAGAASLFEGAARQELERSVLPKYLRGQRWFGGKARRIDSVRFADWGALPVRSSQSFLTLLEVHFADGAADLYFLPLVVTNEGPQPSHVLARLTGPDGGAVLRDALADDGTCAALLEAIPQRREAALQRGRVHAFPTAAYARLRGRAEDPLPVSRGPETSSNTLVLFGRRLLLKLFRRLEVGTNPDFEIGRYLTEASAFDRTPRTAGTIEYDRPDGGHITLAILQMEGTLSAGDRTM